MGVKKNPLKNAMREELEAIAFATPFDFIKIEETDSGHALVPLPSNEIPCEKMKAVESIAINSKGVDLKLYNKMKALEMLGKLNGFFESEIKNEIDKIPDKELDKIIHKLEEKLLTLHRNKRKECNE